MNIACVVVTYNRLDCLKKNIECLKKQTHRIDRIFIIDNASSDGTNEYMTTTFAQDDQIEYVRLNENTGGSGGFSYGVEKAYESGADCIWGMDDDAFPHANALEKLMAVRSKVGDKAALWSNCDGNCLQNYEEVQSWMFVGFFITRDMIKKVGFPRNDYFIYWDDHEYARRLRKGGFCIYKVRDSVIEHRDANKNYYPAKKIGFKKLKMYKMADWKVYYYVRNKILTYRWNDINKYEAIFDGFKTYIKCFIFKTHQSKVVMKAIRDGIRNRTGKRMEP